MHGGLCPSRSAIEAQRLVLLLADLSPLSLVPCRIPVWGRGNPRWARHSGNSHLPWGFWPTEGELAGALNTSGTLDADLEMYGGSGLGGNAGGVRCANYAGFQVKGTGPSELGGPGTDKWHRHGALSLQDAMRETVMGELIHLAAPHGAVRAMAIVDLGFTFATEVGVDKLPSSAPRALLFRELSVRAAHFMRSSFMNVGPNLALREVERMRDGIPRFADWLCRDLGQVSFDDAAQGLVLMFDRLMNQVAVLRTKRLVHGSLIPSNFCIDGRLLDFTTSTAVSTFQPVMVSLGGLTSQQQHQQVLRALPELLFYLSKYDPRCKAGRQRRDEVCGLLMAELNQLHHRYLVREHLGLFGFPLAQAMRLPPPLKDALFEALLGGIKAGSTEGHMYFGGDEHPMLPTSGRDDLFALVATAVAETCRLQLPATAHYAPRVSDFPDATTAAVCKAHRQAAEALCASSVSNREIGMAWLIRAMQRQPDLSPLYRRELDGEIDRICRQRADVGEFVRSTVATWSGVFSSPADGTVDLKGWLTGEPAWLLPDGRLQVAQRTCSPLELVNLQPAQRALLRHRWLFEVAALNHAATSNGP